jgi:hypothetical protein
MYIRILNYLINRLEKVRDKLRNPKAKGISAKEWASQHKKWREKSYK